MGNRAIVKPEGKDIGVYLHWNGGIDSVTAFLKYCELKQYYDEETCDNISGYYCGLDREEFDYDNGHCDQYR